MNICYSAHMQNTYLFSGIFKANRMLTDKEIHELRQLISLQVLTMSGVSEDGSLTTSVNRDTVTVIPFSDKVEIVVSPDLLDD